MNLPEPRTKQRHRVNKDSDEYETYQDAMALARAKKVRKHKDRHRKAQLRAKHMLGAPTPATDMPEKFHDYEADEDLRALARAHAVKKNPDRMGRVHAMAKQRLGDNLHKKEEANHAIRLAQQE